MEKVEGSERTKPPNKNETAPTGKKEGHTLLPNSGRHNCFGCSRKNEKGLHMEFYVNKDFDVVTSWFAVPLDYCGWGPIVHGGIVSTMLDEAMGWGALVILGKLVFSRSISVEFLSPVVAETEIRVEGSVKEVVSERKAVVQGAIYSNDVLCARSTSDVSLFTMDYVRTMGALDEAMLGDLEILVNLKGAAGA